MGHYQPILHPILRFCLQACLQAIFKICQAFFFGFEYCLLQITLYHTASILFNTNIQYRVISKLTGYQTQIHKRKSPFFSIFFIWGSNRQMPIFPLKGKKDRFSRCDGALMLQMSSRCMKLIVERYWLQSHSSLAVGCQTLTRVLLFLSFTRSLQLFAFMSI
jgi:hypothetical protein